MVNDAGKTIDTLIANIQKVNEVINKINISAKEQSLEIKQINKVVSHIDESTQRNAALVEESTTSAKSLKEQANYLTLLVDKFKLN